MVCQSGLLFGRLTCTGAPAFRGAPTIRDVPRAARLPARQRMRVGLSVADRGFFDPVPPEYLLLYRYLTAENNLEYIAVMDVLCPTLLADMSAADVRDRLLEASWDIRLDTVEERCLQLVVWANLMKSPRDPHVPTVEAYRHSQKRFQATPQGAFLHRQVRELMRRGDGAREVARELLGGLVVLLDQIAERVSGDGLVDAELLATDVTTVFNNQQVFTDGVRDFYAYLGNVLTRYDLAGEEYSTFKGLLLEYVELISSDVARHTPGIGLASMRERVQFVHGEFTVESEPGHGTVIDLSVPLFRGDHEKAKNPAGR